MNKWQRRTVYYVVGLTGLMIGYAVAYQWGMVNLEDATGVRATFVHALQVVVETFTTTGFGSDAPWESTFMNVLVIAMDTTGTLMIFLALPVLLFPALEDTLSTTVPRAVEGMSDHVVIATYSARAETLVEELDARGVEYVLVEPDGEKAVDLYEEGYEVIQADPETIDGLDGANVASARAVVADVSDHVDTSIVLTAREISEDVRVVSVVEDPDSTDYHELAGADEVLSPRPLLGERLAEVASTGVVTELDDGIEIGEDFEIAELLVHHGSPLAGTELAESNIREGTGVNVIGAWFRGDFETPVGPGTTLEAGTVLLVTGQSDQLERLGSLPESSVREYESGVTLVIGHGEVGQAVTRAFDEAGQAYTVMDKAEKSGVDVVGEADDTDALSAAGIEQARSAILAIPDDTRAEFATLVMRETDPDLDIAARTEDAEAVQKMYRAGANYVLSLAEVTGRMTASAVLENDDIIATNTQVEILRTEAPGVAGQTIAEARIRERTGCTVVAVERNGRVFTDLGPDFSVETGDVLVVAGPEAGTAVFTEQLAK
jgi:Trk K+ transport system NAD-binding subunit